MSTQTIHPLCRDMVKIKSLPSVEAEIISTYHGKYHLRWPFTFVGTCPDTCNFDDIIWLARKDHNDVWQQLLP